MQKRENLWIIDISIKAFKEEDVEQETQGRNVIYQQSLHGELKMLQKSGAEKTKLDDCVAVDFGYVTVDWSTRSVSASFKQLVKDGDLYMLEFRCIIKISAGQPNFFGNCWRQFSGTLFEFWKRLCEVDRVSEGLYCL